MPHIAAGVTESGREFTAGLVGGVAPGLETVADAAMAAVTTGDDLGFQLVVSRGEQVLVDLVGGHLDEARTVPLTRRTLTMNYSVSKGLLGLCLGLLVERQAISLDRPVADYWPEFGAAGKGGISVRTLLRHQAGLPAFERVMSVKDLSDWALCTTTLAAQAPVWKPGTQLGYHPLTIGYLAGELVRRVTGLMPGAYFAREIAQPLGIDGWFGTPGDHLPQVVARVPLAKADADPLSPGAPEAAAYAVRALENPPVADLDVPTVWAADVPAASFVGTAQALARAYSIAVPGPDRLISDRAIDDLLAQPAAGYDHVLLTQPSRFAGLFQLSSPRQPMLGAGSFGHDGYTGNLAFAHRPSGISFAYVCSRPDLSPTPHSRITRILAALRESLDLSTTGTPYPKGDR